MVYKINKGWGVVQDIHEFGEKYEIFKRDYDPTLFGLPHMKAMPPWQPIDRLEHLQLTLAPKIPITIFLCGSSMLRPGGTAMSSMCPNAANMPH